MPYEVPNDVIMFHEKRIEWNILISACMPYRPLNEQYPIHNAYFTNTPKINMPLNEL